MRRGGGWCSEAALKACFQAGPHYTHAQVTPCKLTAFGFSLNPTCKHNLRKRHSIFFEIICSQGSSPISLKWYFKARGTYSILCLYNRAWQVFKITSSLAHTVTRKNKVHRRYPCSPVTLQKSLVSGIMPLCSD